MAHGPRKDLAAGPSHRALAPTSSLPLFRAYGSLGETEKVHAVERAERLPESAGREPGKMSPTCRSSNFSIRLGRSPSFALQLYRGCAIEVAMDRSLFSMPSEGEHHVCTVLGWPTSRSILEAEHSYQGSDVNATW
jgi:hypothetical protein